MDSRSFIDEMLQLQAATVVPQPFLAPQFDNLTQSSSTTGLFPPLDTARSLYTSPSNVNLTISTPTLTNPTSAVNGRQIILDFPLCYNQTHHHHHHHHHHLTRNPSFTQDTNTNPRRVAFPTSRPRIANNSTFNQLKDTVVRVQQRKRQREATVTSETEGAVSEPVVSDATPSSSSSATSVESSSAAKIRRRDSVVHNQEQQQPAQSGSSEGGASSSTPERRCFGNQQITGPVRQHESRNCLYCNGTPQVFTRREVTPMYTSNDIAIANAAFAAAAMNPYIRAPQPVATPNTVLLQMNNHVRLLQETIMNNHVNQQYQYVMPTIPIQTSGMYYVPAPHLRDLTYMLNFINDGLMRDRATIDRHHMFTTADEMPIGASSQDIEKHTEKIVFEKNEEEKEESEEVDRCTVCLCDFEDGKEVRKLHCAHIFHPDCIDKWLSYNKKCPVCRMEVDKIIAESVATTSSQSAGQVQPELAFP